MGQNNSVFGPISTNVLAALLLMNQVKASSQESSISELMRKITSPKKGEEIYMYVAIALVLCLAYVVYNHLNNKKNKLDIE